MKPWIRNILFGGMGAGSAAGDAGLLVLRAGIGLMLAIGHGLAKVYADGHMGPSQPFIAGVGDMGFPAPLLFAWCATLAEFLGGLLLALGLLTRPAALFVAFNMAVAAFVAQLHQPLFGPGSKELPLLYLLPALALMLTGAGRYSFDRLIRR
jgi:putative oxidoreductase